MAASMTHSARLQRLAEIGECLRCQASAATAATGATLVSADFRARAAGCYLSAPAAALALPTLWNSAPCRRRGSHIAANVMWQTSCCINRRVPLRHATLVVKSSWGARVTRTAHERITRGPCFL